MGIPFYEDGGGSGLIVQWAAPGGSWQVLSSDVLSPPNTQLSWGWYNAGLDFQAWAVGGGMVALLSDTSYPTIEQDPWMDLGEPTVSHNTFSQGINYGNDQAFVTEIPEFDAYDQYYMRWRGELIVNNDGWHGMQTVEASAYLSAGSHTIT